MKTLLLSITLFLSTLFCRAQLPPLDLPAGAFVVPSAYSSISSWGGATYRGEMWLGLGGNRYIQRQVSTDGGFSWHYDGSTQSIYIPTLITLPGGFMYFGNGLSRYTVAWSQLYPRPYYYRFVDWTAVNPSPVYLRTPGLRWR